MAIAGEKVTELWIHSLFDVGNVDPDGSVTQPGTMRELLLRCNYTFHADSAFNPRRAGISLLLAHELPPLELGGVTEFADTRMAYEDLDEETKVEIENWVVCNSQLQCRRAANPGNPALAGDEVGLSLNPKPPNNADRPHSLIRCNIALVYIA